MKAVLFVLAMISSTSALASDFYKCDSPEFSAAVDLVTPRGGIIHNYIQANLYFVKSEELEGANTGQLLYTFQGYNVHENVMKRLQFFTGRNSVEVHVFENKKWRLIDSVQCVETANPSELTQF